MSLPVEGVQLPARLLQQARDIQLPGNIAGIFWHALTGREHKELVEFQYRGRAQEQISCGSASPVVPYLVEFQYKGGLQMERKFERDRQAAWDKRKMRTITTKMRRETAEDLTEMCRLTRQTPYRLLKELLQRWMMEQREQWFDQYRAEKRP